MYAYRRKIITRSPDKNYTAIKKCITTKVRGLCIRHQPSWVWVQVSEAATVGSTIAGSVAKQHSRSEIFHHHTVKTSGEKAKRKERNYPGEDAADLTIFMIVPLPMTNCAGILSFPVRPLKWKKKKKKI